MEFSPRQEPWIRILNSDRTILDRIIDLPVFIVKAISTLTIESVLGEYQPIKSEGVEQSYRLNPVRLRTRRVHNDTAINVSATTAHPKLANNMN